MTAFSKKKYLVATALSAVLGVSVFAGTQPADAASNLMDLFRQKREASQGRQAPSDKVISQRGRPATVQEAPKKETVNKQSAARKTVTPVKTVSVKGPQIYDYRPEKLVRIDLGKFDLQLTSATNDLVDDTEITATTVIANPAKTSFQQSYDYLKALDIKAEQSIAEVIAAFYASEQKLIWSDGVTISPKVQEISDLMARANEHGLDPQDYAVTIPVSINQSAAASPISVTDTGENVEQQASVQQQLSAFDILFSARVLRYALDAGEGRIIADRLSGFHDLPRNRVDLTDMLKKLSVTAQPAELLAALHPHNKYYLSLKDQLATIKPELNAVEPIAVSTLIRPGQEHAELPKIIDLILAKAPASYISSYSDMLEQHKGSQLYDNQLVAAIKDYQKLLGKTPDGVIGAQTISAIEGESSAVKRQRLLYAMERLRWLPRDFGDRYVFINQPAYRAQYFEEGNETLAMDVVVGSPRHQTNFFYDNIRTVVFNPSWGVPRSIVMNEMMPRILADSSYLDRNNYEVIVGGKRVPSSSVNWSAVASGKSHVGVRQKPGPNNALGELKIMFPNSHDIYLHDTPSKAAFKRDMRAISHGCIRLADPRAMASAVMSAEKQSLSKYFGKHERGIKVPETVPIYLTYFTAWPEESLSEIRYYDDIYQRDAALTKAFEKTSASRLADS